MNTPWYLRSYVELVLRATGKVMPPAGQVRFAREDFDVSCLPIPPDKLKASKVPRDPSRLEHIVVHVTAVNGGFGLATSAYTRWRRRLEDPMLDAVPQELLEQLVRAGDVIHSISTLGQTVGYKVHDPDRLARRLGLWERYRSTPYHEIASQTGDCVANRRLEQRSYHAGDGNGGAGFAMDCAPDEKLTSDFIATSRHGLLCLANRMVDRGNETPITVHPHRVFSTGRLRDTAREAWMAAIKPTVQDHPDLLQLDYEYRLGGLPLTRKWDPDALYDDRGRRVA